MERIERHVCRVGDTRGMKSPPTRRSWNRIPGDVWRQKWFPTARHKERCEWLATWTNFLTEKGTLARRRLTSITVYRVSVCVSIIALRFRTDIYIYIKGKNGANNFCSFALIPRTREKVNVIRDVESWNYFVVIIGYIFVVNCCDYKIYTTTIRWSMKRVSTSITYSRFHFVAKIELVDRSVFNLYALWARIYIYTSNFPAYYRTSVHVYRR